MINDYIDSETAEIIRRLIKTSYKNKLVATYIDLQLRRDDIESNQDIIDEINNDLDVNYKPQRLMDWRNGSRNCPPQTVEYMRCYIMQYLFADEAADALIELLALDR